MNTLGITLTVAFVALVVFHAIFGQENHIFDEKYAKLNSIVSAAIGSVLTLMLIYFSNRNKPEAIDVARGRAYAKYDVELIEDGYEKNWKVKDTTFVFKEGYHREGL